MARAKGKKVLKKRNHRQTRQEKKTLLREEVGYCSGKKLGPNHHIQFIRVPSKGSLPLVQQGKQGVKREKPDPVYEKACRAGSVHVSSLGKIYFY